MKLKFSIMAILLLAAVANTLYVTRGFPIFVLEKSRNAELLRYESNVTDWTHFHSYAEIVAVLIVLNETYPNIVDVFSIGKSCWNRDIYCVRLTNESDLKPKPEALFVGYHHARELISSELPFYFVAYTAENFGINQAIAELLNQSEIYVVIALNVDGFDLFEANGKQRKNARDVDLNRNYDYAWENGVADQRSEVYRGPKPFSEPETRAMRDFVLQHNFIYAVSFHSGIEFILYPWGHTREPSPDKEKFVEISRDISKLTKGTPYKQGSSLYISTGTWDDWMYGVASVFAVTCEIFGSVGEAEQFGRSWRSGPLPPQGDTYIRPFDPPCQSTEACGYSVKTIGQVGYSLCAVSEVELRYQFNPYPNNIVTVILRWLPVFFYIANRTINDKVTIYGSHLLV